MTKVLSGDALKNLPNLVTDRSRHVFPQRTDLTIHRIQDAESMSHLEAPPLDPKLRQVDSPTTAVVVMIGTTPSDEDAIALELRRGGWRVAAGPISIGPAEHGAVLSGRDSDDGRFLVNRLLNIVGRRLHGSLHATALAIDQPSAREVFDLETDESVLTFGRLVIDGRRHEVLVDGRDINVSKTQFDLLHLLALQPGRVFSRRELVARIRGAHYRVTERSVDVHIVEIRRKLAAVREQLQTVRGVGYRLVEAPRQEHDPATASADQTAGRYPGTQIPRAVTGAPRNCPSSG